MDKQKTGELIRNARIKKGYTQVELGDLIGVTNKAISRWEKGDSFPDISVIEELSRVLDIRIQDIVIGDVTEPDSETAVTEKKIHFEWVILHSCRIYACMWMVFIQRTGRQFNSGLSYGFAGYSDCYNACR